MLENQLLHHNQTHSPILHPRTDLVCQAHTSLHMLARARDHHTPREMHHDNTPPTTRKQTTMLPSELPLPPFFLLVLQLLEACQNEISLRLQ